MAKLTKRDYLWNWALKRTHRDGDSLSAEKLAEIAETTERSARDTLKSMTEMGFLKERKKEREVTFVANEDMEVA